MNERIRELAKQAGIELPDDSVYNGHIYRNSMERFAELIVRECITTAKHHVMNISTYADADFVEKQIQEHFGIEE